MLVQIPYNRESAIAYAKTWALSRNQQYLNFNNLGGDCTNFASQCIFAGSQVMNYKPTFGWYYNSSLDRSPSWSGVPYLYNFLTTNKGPGPFAIQVETSDLEIGDIIQLGDENEQFYHTPVVCAITPSEILVAAHSYDAYMRPISSYEYKNIRFLHIVGARKYQ